MRAAHAARELIYSYILALAEIMPESHVQLFIESAITTSFQQMICDCIQALHPATATTTPHLEVC